MNSFTVLALFVALLAASQVIIMKHVTTRYSSETSFALFSMFYFVLSLLFMGRHKELINKEIRVMVVPVIMLILLAVVCSFTSNYLYYKLMERNDMTVTTALISVVPIFIAIYSLFILKQSMSMKHIAGVVAVVGGVVLLS
jgi:drug/metabolite transporter (DMT)-like permease